MFTSEEATKLDSFGKIVNEFHFKRVAGYLEDHGGKVILGGEDLRISDRYIEPTIIYNPDKNSALFKNEVFGPIMKIFKFSNFDTLLDQLVREEKPLASYYFGPVSNNANKNKMELVTSSGMFVVNETALQGGNSFLPFGGVGYSGQGRFGGQEGF